MFSPVKRNEPDLYKKISVINNIIKIATSLDSYLAADITEFIKQQVVASETSFA
jgi:hypothetical protein